MNTDKQRAKFEKAMDGKFVDIFDKEYPRGSFSKYIDGTYRYLTVKLSFTAYQQATKDSQEEIKDLNGIIITLNRELAEALS